jgi:hypothetical protein
MDHPKIRADAQGSLYLNFGDYGQEVEVACFSADGTRAAARSHPAPCRADSSDAERRSGRVWSFQRDLPRSEIYALVGVEPQPVSS